MCKKAEVGRLGLEVVLGFRALGLGLGLRGLGV